jgi:hypothetical protein
MPKLLFFLLAVLAGSSTVCQGQKPALDTLSIIQDIRQEFQSINDAQAGFRLVKKDLEDFSTEGGEMRMYYDKENKLRKVVCLNYGETGKDEESYYLKNDSLIFVYIKEMRYDRPIGVTMNPVISKTTEDRYYLFNHRLIRWLQNKNKMDPKAMREREPRVFEEYGAYWKKQP